jgi:hypothetical protein
MKQTQAVARRVVPVEEIPILCAFEAAAVKATMDGGRWKNKLAELPSLLTGAIAGMRAKQDRFPPSLPLS